MVFKGVLLASEMVSPANYVFGCGCPWLTQVSVIRRVEEEDGMSRSNLLRPFILTCCLKYEKFLLACFENCFYWKSTSWIAFIQFLIKSR